MTKPTRKSPTPKSPKERAQERLAVAERAASRARARVDELDALLEHRKADPDLRDDPTLPLGGES